MRRINFELSEADKDRFKKAVFAIESNMTAVLREFLPQWCEQQETTDFRVPRFLVVGLDEELYRIGIDRTKAEKTTANQVVCDYLKRWVERGP